MRKIARKILEILDGTPAVYGDKRQGQSLVEMTLITPLLIIMIVGIVEIGWFANNYLILLESTRVAARRGAVLSGDNSPGVWLEEPSVHYEHRDRDPRYDPGQIAMDETNPAYDPYFYHGTDEDQRVEDLQRIVRNCAALGQAGVYQGFFNLVLCQMINSIDPLEINYDWADPLSIPEEERRDDIVISAFAVQMINNDTPVLPNRGAFPADAIGEEAFQQAMRNYERTYDLSTAPNNTEFIAGFNPVVVGRYPANANECTRWESTLTGNVFDAANPYERDPFDYIEDEALTGVAGVDWSFPIAEGFVNQSGGLPVHPDSGDTLPTAYPIELAVRISTPGLSHDWAAVGRDRNDLGESQRGFSYTGYRKVESWSGLDEDTDPRTVNGQQVTPDCIGSDWTIYDIQALMLTDEFQLTGETREFLNSQGVVLVEVFWTHQLLIQLPLLSPFFAIFGNDDGTTEIYVWSAFPVPTAVPDLEFNLTWENFFSP